MLVDLRLGLTKLRATPQFRWVLLFYAWSLVTLVVKAPARSYVPAAVPLSVAVVLYVVIAHGVQTFRGLYAVILAVLAMSLFVTGVSLHQGFAPFGCIVTENDTKESGRYDGRPCETPVDCTQGDTEPGAIYVCEHVGLFGTNSIGRGRVRYRGVLEDPNEVALAVSAGLPFVFALRERTTFFFRLLFLGATLVAVALCCIFTQSRGGQLVFLAVLGAYFVKKYGLRGAVIGAAFAAPLLLLGGRSGDEASSSSMERLECMQEGLSMLFRNPILGVGYDQFLEHHYLTAHNAYLLAASEQGVVGLFLWSSVLYLSVKIPVLALRQYANRSEAKVARIWAMALLSGFSGLLIGIFFLSFTYHYVLWIFFGLSGALYSAVRTHDKNFEVSYGWRDLAFVVLADGTLISAIWAYSRYKAGAA